MRTWIASLLMLLPFGAAAHPQEEPVEIVGVVSGLGATASHSMGDPQWRGAVTLVAWRIAGGEVATGELYLTKPLGESGDATHSFTEAMPSQSTVRLRLAGPPERSGTGFRGEIAEILGPASDTQLAAAAHAALNPAPYEHESLGTFIPWPRLPNIFRGETKWGGRTITVTLSGNRPAADRETLDDRAQTALAVLSRQDEIETSLKAALVREYYQLWLGEWRAPNEARLSEARWLARMQITGIHTYAEGTFEIEVADGGLFAGHVLVASGSLEEGITDVGLHG